MSKSKEARKLCAARARAKVKNRRLEDPEYDTKWKAQRKAQNDRRAARKLALRPPREPKVEKVRKPRKTTHTPEELENLRKVNVRSWKRSGWTEERIASAKEQQGNCCAICRDPFTVTPHADHRHVVPPIPRALLCSGCNGAIGMFKESPEICEAAAQYLRRWNT